MTLNGFGFIIHTYTSETEMQMITPSKLQELISHTPHTLATVLDFSGYTGAQFKSAEFIGITNSGQFCYKVVYHDECGTGEAVGKVFLAYKKDGTVVADY